MAAAQALVNPQLIARIQAKVHVRVGLEGRGIDVYERRFWERTPLRFEYDYVGLPALEGANNLGRENLLAVALSATIDDTARAGMQAGKAAAASGIEIDALDRTIDPCTDFYQFACGNWLKKAEIPPDQTAWISFVELQERNLDSEGPAPRKSGSTAPPEHTLVPDNKLEPGTSSPVHSRTTADKS